MKTMFERSEIKKALSTCEIALRDEPGASNCRDYGAIAALADLPGDSPLTLGQSTAVSVSYWLDKAKLNS